MVLFRARLLALWLLAGLFQHSLCGCSPVAGGAAAPELSLRQIEWSAERPSGPEVPTTQTRLLLHEAEFSAEYAAGRLRLQHLRCESSAAGLALSADYSQAAEQDLGQEPAFFWRPAVDLPLTFQLELEFSPRLWRHSPYRLLWSTAARSFSSDYLAKREQDPDNKLLVRYEVLEWGENLAELRFDLRHRDAQLELVSARLYALPARRLGDLGGASASIDLGGVVLPARTVATPSALGWKASIPAKARLETCVGLSAEAMDPGLAGSLRFSIHAMPSGECLATKTLSLPLSKLAWQRLSLELASTADAPLELEFRVEPSSHAVHLPALRAYWGGTQVLIPKRTSDPRLIVLAVLDTTRQDKLSVYGHERPTTPFLEELAEDALVFASAYSQAPWTAPSMASLMTSRTSGDLGVAWGRFHGIPATVPTLAEALSAAGFSCAAFSGNPVLTPASGHARGFDAFHYSSTSQTDGADLIQAALSWHSEHKNERAFLYVHFMDAHAPYDFREQELRELFSKEVVESLARDAVSIDPSVRWEANAKLYEGELRALDAHLKQLYQGLVGHYDKGEFVFLVAADHGEEFLEHGFHEHGGNLFDPQVRVPLLISWPSVLAPARILDPVQNLDWMPTILDIAQVVPPPGLMGMSLLDFAGLKHQDRLCWSETDSSGPLRSALRSDDYAYFASHHGDPFYDSPASPKPEVVAAQAHLPFESLHAIAAGELVAGDLAREQPEILRKMRSESIWRELAQHTGPVLRLRGPLQGEAAATHTLRGSLRSPGAALAGVRLRFADPNRDHFERSADFSELHFSVDLSPEREVMIYWQEPGLPSGAVALTLESRCHLSVGVAEPELATSAALSLVGMGHPWEELLPGRDAVADFPLVQLWENPGRSGASATPALDPAQIQAMEAMGYIGGEGGD